MTTLVSLYSNAVSVNVNVDELAPKPVVLTTVTCSQDTNTGAIPTGRSTVTLNWDLPTENEDIEDELIGESTGGEDVFFTMYAPIVEGKYTVKADGVDLVEDTHYTIHLPSGRVDLIDGQVSSGEDITVSYTTELLDLSHLEIYRIPGDLPLAADATYGAVTGHEDVETVDSNVSNAETSKEMVLSTADNGTTWSYYVFAVDDEFPANISKAAGVMVETIPSIPQDLSKTTTGGSVTLFWENPEDDNFSGINIYRSDGPTFDPENAHQVNSVLVLTEKFNDSDGNALNRVSEVELPYPQNGQVYTYRIEAVDTETYWDVGTRNQSFEQAAILVASKPVI